VGDPNGLPAGALPASGPAALPPAPPVKRAEPKPASRPAAEPIRIKVGTGVQEARLIERVKPAYPRLAVTARISGVVELEAIIGTDGRIREITVLGGHPMLVPAALEAVRQWAYRPTLLNGEPVEVITRITVRFVLGES
jgi:protein TonB